VLSALTTAAELGANSLALSALGTGEGRVEPRVAAAYMLDGVRAFRGNEGRAKLAVTFCLPSFRDYEAFRAVYLS